MHYTCIACIGIDSVMKMEKKELSTSLFRRMQVQGEEKKMPQFKDVEFESDLDSE